MAPDGRVWVADTRNDRLQVFTPITEHLPALRRTGQRSRASSTTPWASPSPATPSTSPTRFNNRVQKLTLTGAPLATFGGLTAPEGVAVAPDGTVWVADTGANRILHLSADLVDLGETFGGPRPGSRRIQPAPHPGRHRHRALRGRHLQQPGPGVRHRSDTGTRHRARPAGTLTSPTPGATVHDPTTVSGTATDDVGVTAVEIAVTQGATRLR